MDSSTSVCGSWAPGVNTEALHLKRNNPLMNVSETTGPPTPSPRTKCFKLHLGFSFSSLFFFSLWSIFFNPHDSVGGGRGQASREQGRRAASGDVSPLIPLPQPRAAAALTTSPDTLTKSTAQSLEVF